MQQNPSWEANSCLASQSISLLLGNLKWITAVTRSRYSFSSWSRIIESLISHTIALWLILILPSYTEPYLLICFFSSSFSHVNSISCFRLSDGRHMTLPYNFRFDYPYISPSSSCRSLPSELKILTSTSSFHKYLVYGLPLKREIVLKTIKKKQQFFSFNV